MKKLFDSINDLLIAWSKYRQQMALQNRNEMY
jgi:hypothetical protein